MEQPLGKVNLVPPQRDQLANPETVPEGNENHRAVTMSVPPEFLGSVDEAFNLGWGQKLPTAAFRIGHPAGWLHRTFPKTSSGGGKSDFKNVAVFKVSSGGTFP